MSARQILIVTQEFPPRVGGAGVVAQQHAEALVRLGHDVTVLTRDWGGVRFSGRLITTPSGQGGLWLAGFLRAINKLDLDAFDAILVNDIGAALAASVSPDIQKHLYKVSCLLHGSEIESILKFPKLSFRLLNFPKRYIRLLNACRAVIAVSQHMKECILEATQGIISPDRVQVVYAGVDELLFKRVNVDLKAELSLDQGTDVLLSVGRIISGKGFARQADIFERCLARRPELRWVIVGSGPFERALKDILRRRCIEHAVVFTGGKPREQLARYYSGCDLFWLMTEREAFGLVYAEAQMCGTPCLGPDAFGVREAVEENVGGWLVDTDEESEAVILSAAYRHMSPDRVSASVEKFSLHNQIKALLEKI